MQGAVDLFARSGTVGPNGACGSSDLVNHIGWKLASVALQVPPTRYRALSYRPTGFLKNAIETAACYLDVLSTRIHRPAYKATRREILSTIGNFLRVRHSAD